MKARNNIKHVSVLVTEDAVLSSLSGSYSLLLSANERSKQEGQKAQINNELVGSHVKNVQLILPVQFICTKTISDEFHTGLIIVPPISTLSLLLGAIVMIDLWIRRDPANFELCTCRRADFILLSLLWGAWMFERFSPDKLDLIGGTIVVNPDRNDLLRATRVGYLIL